MSSFTRAPRPHRLFWLACLLALSACGPLSDWFRPAPETKDPASILRERHKNASDFVYHLSIAELFLENGEPLKMVGNNAAVINRYAQSARTKPIPLTVALVSYRTGKPRRTLQAIIPVEVDGALPYLSKSVTRLGKFPHTLEDIRLVSLPVQPDTSLRMNGKDEAQALASLRATHTRLLANASALPEQDAARAGLPMLAYFIKHRQKDAAYLCADTIKRLLAKAALEHPGDTNDINALSKTFAELEGRLHMQMPY